MEREAMRMEGRSIHAPGRPTPGALCHVCGLGEKRARAVEKRVFKTGALLYNKALTSYLAHDILPLVESEAKRTGDNIMHGKPDVGPTRTAPWDVAKMAKTDHKGHRALWRIQPERDEVRLTIWWGMIPDSACRIMTKAEGRVLWCEMIHSGEWEVMRR